MVINVIWELTSLVLRLTATRDRTRVTIISPSYRMTVEGPVVRRLDSAIQQIAIFSSFLEQLVNGSDPN